MEREIKILNSTFEVALRILAIMVTCKKAMTIERLSIYSYFALYLSDLDHEEESLHPEIPHRNSSYINSRDVMLSAMEMLLARGVATSVFSNSSIRFSTTDLGIALFSQIGGEYKEKLVTCIMRAHKLMEKKSDKKLNSLVYDKMAEWGSEFSYESVLKEFEYEE